MSLCAKGLIETSAQCSPSNFPVKESNYDRLEGNDLVVSVEVNFARMGQQSRRKHSQNRDAATFPVSRWEDTKHACQDFAKLHCQRRVNDDCSLSGCNLQYAKNTQARLRGPVYKTCQLFAIYYVCPKNESPVTWILPSRVQFRIFIHSRSRFLIEIPLFRWSKRKTALSNVVDDCTSQRSNSPWRRRKSRVARTAELREETRYSQ